ncbi:MAG: cobalamin-independent methionine synthase II family protein [Alphaproteobacteria bacterium]|nr:cobalamin-independent methionine synthase II family protein [Alphaproteobacteria bacterium]
MARSWNGADIVASEKVSPDDNVRFQLGAELEQRRIMQHEYESQIREKRRRHMAIAVGDLRNLRVDQVGALRAPASLRQLFEKREIEEVSEKTFVAAREKAIAEIIHKQEEIGLPVVTDGELRRRNFQDSFHTAVRGFSPRKAMGPGENVSQQPYTRTESAGSRRWPVTEKLSLERNVPLEEFRRSAAMATNPVKVTLLSADRIADQFDPTGAIYTDVEEFIADVVAIERAMIAELVAVGCRYIQIDAPGYTSYVDDISISEMRSIGEDPEKRLARSIAADNAVIAGFDGVVFGLHVCRGGARTLDPKTGKVAPQWHREGYYDAIAEQLFSELHHDRLLLEYDSERAGSFAPLRFVPKEKVAVLGLVTTKSPDIESSDELRRRIDEAAVYLPLDNLALSPQCGFGGYRKIAIEEDLQWKKFEVIVETARAIWD